MIKLRALGPGLVWAAAAIGVSHLVQSTRAKPVPVEARPKSWLVILS